jgi:P27 family predicted phage terminase small subunit
VTAPTPLEKRRLTGNPGKRPIPTPVAVIEGAVDRIPDAPEFLGVLGKRRWGEVWSVADKWLVPTLDMGLLVRYCEGFDERAYWQGLLKREGRMSRGSTGQPKVHPAVEELHRLDERLTRWEAELGFTPIGRTRLHVEKRDRAPERKLDKYTRTG